MRRIHASLTAIVLVLLPGLAGFSSLHAQSVAVRFSGTVTSLSPGYAIPGINLGDAVSGVLTYDAATEDEQPISWIGLYPEAITNLVLSIGTNTYALFPSFPNNEIVVLNDDLVHSTYYDSLLFRAGVFEGSDPGTSRFFQLTFSTSDTNPPSVLSGDALPANLDLRDLSGGSGFITYMPPGASEGCNFSLESADLCQPPELQIARSGTHVVLSWGSPSTNFVLETIGLMKEGASWSLIPDPPAVSGTNYTVTHSAGSSAGFYRLRMQ